MGQKAEVWYLGHSGFAVAVEDEFLIFDYYIDTPEGESCSLNTGVIVPDEIRNKKVRIFSSHRHPDHFNPVILSWKEALPDAEYYLSSDIPEKFQRDWIHFLKPNDMLEQDGLTIRTFKSTDQGVAFLVTLHGINIYHAGDLNWWHWDEEPKSKQNDKAARFQHEVSLIGEFPLDIAFLTADPRQENAELWGITWFLEHVDVKTAFPMHFGADTGIMERISQGAAEHPALKKVNLISHRGQNFLLEI